MQYWAPQAAGAGVTLVMAYLNGNHVPNLLRVRTLVTKLLGTICSVGAGLPMGPEGPMVHIGACLASVITYAQCSELLLHKGCRRVPGAGTSMQAACVCGSVLSTTQQHAAAAAAAA